MKTNFKTHLLLLALLSLPGFAHAQGTAFTYNGRLNNNGVPVNGPYEMRFTLYDEVGGSNVIAGPLPPIPADVVNGLFTVRLDFGAGVFTGPARWLNVEVRPVGVVAFTALTPRQEVTSSPYAIRAQTAGNVANSSVVANQLNTGGVAPTPGQFLSYNGGNLFWSEPGVLAGNIWSLNGADAFYNAGNVGIGTASPTAKLDVRGDMTIEAGASPGIFTGTGNAELNRYLYLLNSPTFPSASGFKAGGILVADSYSYANPGKNDLIVKGKIGIGTATPATKLTVQTVPGLSINNFYGFEHTDGTVRLTTYVDGASGQIGTRSNHPLSFFVNDGYPSLTIDTAGNLRYDGTMSKLDVADNFIATIRAADLYLGYSGRRGTPGRALVDFGDSLVLNFGSDWANTVIGGANVSVCTLTIRGGCDLAEPFLIKEATIEKGAVVVIDREHPGRLQRSTHAYDKRVAGIVSGANGISPGIALKQEGALDQGENVALTGRVYVQADASFGEIEPGDLLTTSDTPGHAMKVTEHSKAQGAVLGKAMSTLKEGKGMVLVLVTLQ